MAIATHYQHQFHTKLPKKAGKLLYNQIHGECLHGNFDAHWQSLKNKERLYLRSTWSNLQRAQDVIAGLLETQDFGRSASAIRRLLQELQEAQEDSVQLLHNLSYRNSQGFRTDYTPREYRMQKEAFQFVLDQFGHSYDWRLIPHRFWYKNSTHPRCWYRRWKGTACNGGHHYEIHIDPTGSFHKGRWYTYGRNSLGWKAKGILVGEEYPDFLHMNYLVHEITHAVENYYSQCTRQKYSKGETNTTLMELRHARAHYPALFRKLTPVQDGRKNSWWSPVDPLEGQDPEAQLQQHRQAASPPKGG